MKKLTIILAISLLVLSACTTKQNTDTPVDVPEKPIQQETPIDEPDNPTETTLDFIGETLKLTYASGAGAWSSDITISKDGSFKGQYHDSNMGETGEGYPNGTVYLCNWFGSFYDIEKVDDYTYSMTLKSIGYEKQVGSDWIEDGTKFIPSGPAGFSENVGTKYLLLLPGKPISEIPENLLWCNMRYTFGDRTETELSQYCLYSPSDEYSAFYSYDD